MNNKDKRVLTIIVLICFVSMSICVYFDQYASADALTIGMVAGAAIAIGSAWGASYVFSNGSNRTTVMNCLTNQINSFLAGRSLTEVFGSEIVRNVAGKLVIPSVLANAILDFWLDTCDENGIDPVDGGMTHSYVFIDGTPVLNTFDMSYTQYQPDLPIVSQVASTGFSLIQDGGNVDLYFRGVRKVDNMIWGNGIKYYLQINNGNVVCIYKVTGGASGWYNVGDFSIYEGHTYALSVDEGTIFYNELTENEDINIDNLGQDWDADTNIEDMLSDIFDDYADNNLVVDGEIVEPAPGPTPAPTFEPWPTHAPVDDVIDGLNDLLNQGEISIHNQGVISSAAERAAEAAEEATAAIEEALDIPTVEEIPLYKFDLRTLFPFCIPFDIYNLLQAFDGVAAAPRFQIPIVIQSIGFSYTMDLDFSAFDSVAAVLRQVELIAFAIALAFGTSKVIRW